MTDTYVLRAGHEYLVRRESEGPQDWRPHYVGKVLNFSPEELVDVPRGHSYLSKNYIFRRKGWLISAQPEQMLRVPVKESIKEFVQLALDQMLDG